MAAMYFFKWLPALLWLQEKMNRHGLLDHLGIGPFFELIDLKSPQKPDLQDSADHLSRWSIEQYWIVHAGCKAWYICLGPTGVERFSNMDLIYVGMEDLMKNLTAAALTLANSGGNRWHPVGSYFSPLSEVSLWFGDGLWRVSACHHDLSHSFISHSLNICWLFGHGLYNLNLSDLLHHAILLHLSYDLFAKMKIFFPISFLYVSCISCTFSFHLYHPSAKWQLC